MLAESATASVDTEHMDKQLWIDGNFHEVTLPSCSTQMSCRVPSRLSAALRGLRFRVKNSPTVHRLRKWGFQGTLITRFDQTGSLSVLVSLLQLRQCSGLIERTDLHLQAFSSCILLLLAVTDVTSAQTSPINWTASPFNPPALPLAVRSPYLNVWLPQGNNPPQAHEKDNMLWDYNLPIQWYASVVVDDNEYRLLSPWAEKKVANQKAVEFTATRTSFLMEAGGVEFNMTFLSPIEPNDFTRQSLPFSYMYMIARATDGQPHRVRMYSDIEGNIAAGDTRQVVQWAADDTDDCIILSTQLQNQKPFVETNNIAQDATVYYSFRKIKGFTASWKISGFNSARGLLFSQPINGRLNNSADTRFRAPSLGDDTPVLGISIDWGNITSTPEAAVWSLGMYRNPSMQYLMSDGSFQQRSPYFMSIISKPLDAPKFVLDDFPRALSAAIDFDTKLRVEGNTVSPKYADLLALTARQVMGAMDITIPPAKDGAWDVKDVKIFMKNLGSVGSDNGGKASVNNVGALYAAFPAFLYLNPDIGGYLLSPLLELQESKTFTLPYAAKNIGSRFPNATGDGSSDFHTFGIDHTASMLIMTLAYAMASGNGTLIATHYRLLRRWGEWLGNNSATPFLQSSGDFSISIDASTANQTNLALKGIIGIAAMAKIADAAGEVSDRDRFNATAHAAIDLWQKEAVSPSSVNFVYGSSTNSALIYNLYADKLLKLNLVPDSVYELLTGIYQSSAGSMKYGIPLSSQPSQNTSTNWMMFAASTVTNNGTRDVMISQVYEYASSSLNNAPFSSLYDPSTGVSSSNKGTGSGRASPTQGGLFALLALGTTSKTINLTPLSSGFPSSSSPAKISPGAIAGVVIAAIAALTCVIVLAVIIIKRRRDRREDPQNRATDGLFTTSATSRPPWAGVMNSKSVRFDAQQRGVEDPSMEISAATQTSRSGRAASLQLQQDIESLRRDMEQIRMRQEQPLLGLAGDRHDISPPSYSG
ncbi:Glutaminase GtaA [Pleurotus pulmonarius]